MTSRLFPLLCLFLIPGCNEEATMESGARQPGEMSALIPIAVGNRWVYIDSLFTDSVIVVDTFTVTIEGYRIDTLAIWWRFHDSRIPGTYVAEFAVRNDSMFSLQYNEDRTVVSLEYIPPPPNDTLRFTSMFGGDVLIEKAVFPLAGTCRVPAGTFEGCAVYSWRTATLEIKEIMKPGLGILVTSFSGKEGERRISLMAYELEESPPAALASPHIDFFIR